VTHVIRGDDHISNTPRQILLLRAIGVDTPLYAHVPLLLGPDRKKLSKRSGAKPILQYKEEGFIPETLINYLSLLGWHPQDEQEVFTLDELTDRFQIERIQKGAAIFDEVKLRGFNREHLRRLPEEEYLSRLTLFMGARGESVPEYLSSVAEMLRERAETFADAAILLGDGEFSFMEDAISVDKELLLKGAKAAAPEVRINLECTKEILSGISLNNWNEEQVKAAVFPFASDKGRAQVLWPMRVALTNKEKSPDPFIVAALIGKEKSIERIRLAIESLMTSN